MPQNFTKEDFAKMQQQAINRVREMQRQSKMNDSSISDNKNYTTPTEKSDPPIEQSSSKSKEQIVSDKGEQKKKTAQPPPIKRVYTKSKPNPSPFFEMDSDIALILPLLLLLQRDGADEMLILALLYIMS